MTQDHIQPQWQPPTSPVARWRPPIPDSAGRLSVASVRPQVFYSTEDCSRQAMAAGWRHAKSPASSQESKRLLPMPFEARQGVPSPFPLPPCTCPCRCQCHEVTGLRFSFSSAMNDILCVPIARGERSSATFLDLPVVLHRLSNMQRPRCFRMGRTRPCPRQLPPRIRPSKVP